MLVRFLLIRAIRWNLYWTVVFFNLAERYARKNDLLREDCAKERMNYHAEICADAIGVIMGFLDEIRNGS